MFSIRRFFLTYDFFIILRKCLVNPFTISEKLNSLKFSGTVDFYLYFFFSNSFNFVNLNILETIFLKNLDDFAVWVELNKMFSWGLIGFSNKYIYEKDSLLTSSLLSVFLFEIYYLELDNYIFYLSLQYNSTKSIVNNSYSFFTLCNHYISVYCPLKLEKLLYYYFSCLNFLAINHFSKLFPFLVYDHRSFLIRRLHFIRYKDRLFVSINGSRDFAYLVYGKLFFFFRSRLLVDVLVSKVFPFGSESIYFLGFKINSFNLQSVSYSKSKFTYSVLSRLGFIQKRLMGLFLKRILLEFCIIFGGSCYNNLRIDKIHLIFSLLIKEVISVKGRTITIIAYLEAIYKVNKQVLIKS